MIDFEQIRRSVASDLQSLELQIRIVYEELVLPGWDTPDRHGFDRALYGFIMNTLAFIDLLSQYQAGTTKTRGQTLRMARLLRDYLGSPPEEAEMAVRLWRHTLMHTGSPRVLVDQDSGRRLRWLLHWRDELPRSHHFTFVRTDSDTILNLGAVYLVEELVSAVNHLFKDLAESPPLREQVERVEAELSVARFRVPG